MIFKCLKFHMLVTCFAPLYFWLFTTGIAQGQALKSWMNDVVGEEHIIKNNQEELAFLIDEEHYLAIREHQTNSLKMVRRISDGRVVVVGSGLEESTRSKLRALLVNNKWKWSESVFRLKKFKKVAFLVSLVSDDTIEIQEIIDKYQLSHIRSRYYSGFGTKSELTQLAQFGSVRYISLASIEAKEESRVIDLNLNPNRIAKVHAKSPHLDGDSLTVSVKERAFDPSDVDLRGRSNLSGLESADISNHATEMTTVIAGAGNSFITGRGVASGALLTGASFEVLFPENLSDYKRLNIHVQNHSYGTEVENYYGLSAQAYDQSVIDAPTLVHVFSAGNSGDVNPVEGDYAGVGAYANLTGNFKNAKNVLTVGAVDTVGRSQFFSSRGPSGDGRIKPDLSAYSMVGSSNSAALVSGTVLLMQQQFLAQWGFFPTADLIKAVLIAGAEDLDDPGPDYQRGFGNMNAFESVEILKGNQFIQDTLRSEMQSYSVNVSQSIQKLTVALAWTDPPANPGDEITLINNLDLKVVAPDGSIILPWILSRESVLESLQSSAIRGVDDVNNVEVVSFEVDDPGLYTLEVSGRLLMANEQGFSIAYKADTSDLFTWDYPLKGSHMPYNGETGTYFRWSSTLKSTLGDLYYSYREDANWTLIRSGLDLTDGYWRWDAAMSMSPGLVEAMMVVGLDTFKTEVFTVSTSLDANVGFDCGDSVLLQWPHTTSVNTYLIKQPGERYLEDLVLVEDSLFLLSEPINSLFSITPIVGNFELLPSYTFDYREQQSGCFIQSFYQEVEVSLGIYLNVQLGSVYGIESIQIESWQNNQYVVLYETNDPKRVLRILDSNPNQGYNQHRLSISLDNGQILQQVVGDTYFLTTTDVLVFPNPIRRNELLQVYTRETAEEIRIRIHDSEGRLVSDGLLASTRAVISLTNYHPGLYYYTVRIGDTTRKGKLLVR